MLREPTQAESRESARRGKDGALFGVLDIIIEERGRGEPLSLGTSQLYKPGS